MSMVVVGGPTKGAGKTTLICGILAAMPEREWTAIKITSHAYRGVPITEEMAREPTTDTGRYLLAGARRALLVEAPEDADWTALVKEICRRGENLIVESNRIVNFLAPDVCLGVLGKGFVQAKPSFTTFLSSVDGLIARAGVPVPQDSRRPGVPLFAMDDFSSISPEFAEWVRARLSRPSRSETAQS